MSAYQAKAPRHRPKDWRIAVGPQLFDAAFATPTRGPALASGLPTGQTLFPVTTYRASHPATASQASVWPMSNTFGRAQRYSVQYGGWSVAVGDFNGDHKLDLVTGNGDGLSVLLGNGDGTFQQAKNYTFPNGVYLTECDVNGDGKLDLVTGVSYPEAVVVLLGNGDGTFQAGPTYTGSGAAVAVGDFNADGKLDVVTKTVLNPSTRSSVLNLLPGNGDGTFGAAQPIFGNDPAYPVAIEGVTVGDFNGDGTLDLAAVWVPVGYYGSIGGPLYDQEIVLLGGSGGFSWPTNFGYSFTGLYSPLPYSVIGLAAADVNGDGKLDLIAMNDKGWVDILSGNGDGTFGVFDHSYEMAYSTGNLAFVVGDFNGDGFPDLAALRRGFVDVYLWTSKTQW
jgi:hypothetical protein